ncbi:MAG: hypothetical protein KDI19_14255 [Pseudomonadales bacterium]|nr:hypothetical protein [Pseudomonadales bacterium]
MRNFILSLVLVGVAGAPVTLLADDQCGGGRTTVVFVRSDLASLKKNLVAAIAAVPVPDAPYGRESEDWNLPSYACQDKEGIEPVDASYRTRFSTEGAMQQKGADYQKAMLEAQAKGDYEALMKINQQMQAEIMQQAAANQQLRPVELAAHINDYASATIDPDAVLRDGPGFIAIRTDQDLNDGTERVSVYFDPVELKDAQEVASFEFPSSYRALGKLDILNLRVEISGPVAAVEKMVKGIEAQTILQTLTGARKQAK